MRGGFVALAHGEARRLNHDRVGTEHILLGLIQGGDGVAAKALESPGISLDAVRQQTEQMISQNVLNMSLREALRFGDNHTATGNQE
jgi:ATP-dependent Clp protease ATP-binding subunit ClpC